MENLKEKVLSVFKSKAFLVGAAAFALPALVLYIVFIINGLHPFGDKQILVTDLWHQYYPFLCEMQERLQNGQSLLYSENIGLGINFWALIAYYCASPLNFLITLVSKEGLRDLVAIMVTLKVGFSSLFFSLYLKKVHSRYDVSTVVFSMLYALCGYVLGYYWNIMWHDCVMLLPLVMMGVYSLITEGKWKLYVFSLALAVISNFYIGFMVCIFTAIYFFCECLKRSMKMKEFFKKLALIAVTSILALALTAFMTIPAYVALQDTVSTASSNTKEKSFSDRFDNAIKDIKDDGADIVGRMASFNEPVPKTGLPNIFSGFICVILLGFFFISDKIKLREKLAVGGMLLILLLSMIIGDIDIIWHGLHKPNMVPYRYAFVFSFALIGAGYKAFDAEFNCEDCKSVKNKLLYIIPLLISGAVIICAWNEAKTATVIGCIAITIVYFVMLLSIKQGESVPIKQKWSAALCAIIAAEVIINTIIAVPTVRTTTYSTYYYRGEEIEELLDIVEDDEDYSRIETSQEYILNDPALYGYKGVSTFTSTANYHVTKLMEKLALCAPAKANRYYYQTTSPLVNALLSVKHVIFKNDMKNLNPYLEEKAVAWTPETDKGSTYRQVIYENTALLPIGFMANGSILSEGGITGENPFEIQNDLFRKLTGLEGDLFTAVPLKSVSAETNVKVTGSEEGKLTLSVPDNEEDPKLEINYVAPDENSLYAYIDDADIEKIIVSNTTYKVDKRKYIFPAGQYEAEEKFQFRFNLADSFKEKSTMRFHVYSMNEELFEKGLDLLNQSPFEIDEYESTRIEGRVYAEEDGVFFTSIPYEKGWRMYIDGEKADIEPFENALIAANVTKGEHEIVLKYSPYGFVGGVLISIAGLIIIAILIILERRKSK